MIIYEWKRKVRELGGRYDLLCAHCNDQVTARLIKVSNWFTLFFIPLFPNRNFYYLRCPHCGKATQVKKDQLAQLRQSEAPAADSLQQTA